MFKVLSAAEALQQVEEACRKVSFIGQTVNVTTHSGRVTVTVGALCSAWFTLETYGSTMTDEKGTPLTPCRLKSYVDLLGSPYDREACNMTPKLALAFQMATWALTLEAVTTPFFLSGPEASENVYKPVLEVATRQARRHLRVGGQRDFYLEDRPQVSAQLSAILEQECAIEFSVEDKGYKLSKHPSNGMFFLLRVYLPLKGPRRRA